MAKLSKRAQAIAAKVDRTKLYPVADAQHGVQVFRVAIAQADASVRSRMPDRSGCVGSVNAVALHV